MKSLLSESWLSHEDQTARYFHLPATAFEQVISGMKERGAILVEVFGLEDFETYDGCCLLYVFEILDCQRFDILVLSGVTDSGISIAATYPAATLFEREIADGFGISFQGATDTRRLFLHESYPSDFHPLRKSVVNQPITKAGTGDTFRFREISGAGVYQIPVGPVHAGIIEPGHFRFSVIGEEIAHLEIHLGYLHRGIEKIAEGMGPQRAVKVAESISGDESVANACGLSLAVEQICDAEVPLRAVYLRGILAELERAYTLLSDLAGMVTDIAYPVAASRYLILREILQQAADMLTGSRFMKGMICIGGLTQDIPPDHLQELFRTAGDVEQKIQTLTEQTLAAAAVLDRLSTTGIVRSDLVAPLALSGPVARASGCIKDTRIDHPYGIYHERPPEQHSESAGDVLARFMLKYQEILSSLRYIQELTLFVPAGEVKTEVRIRDGYALAATESSRGMALHWVYIRDGRISRYKVRTASFCNWYALEHAVMGNIVPDFPLINKSMNLSYAGTDL